MSRLPRAVIRVLFECNPAPRHGKGHCLQDDEDVQRLATEVKHGRLEDYVSNHHLQRHRLS